MFSTTFANDLLKLILTNVAIANIGDASGLQPSASAGNLYIALHTADPGAGGSQTTSEATYTGYARVAIARSGGGWTITNNQAENASLVEFAQCTGGSNTITHFSVGTAASSTGKVLWRAALQDSLAVSNLITPRFLAGDLSFTAVTS